MLLTPIPGNNPGGLPGGIGLLSGDTVPDVADLAKISAALAKLLATAVERILRNSQQVSSGPSTDELPLAGRLQSRILPEKPPLLEGWEIVSKLIPASKASGDFYDFIPLANDKWGILIADVTDKGLGAAVFMAMCSSLIRTYAIRFPTLPALALSSVNERIFTDMRGGLFLTAFYGILEPETGQMRYVNAGHNSPILLGDSKPIHKLNRTGMALGISEEATWQQETVTFSPGDVLVMYTDGITEAHNQVGDYFSEPRLQSVINRHRGKTAAGTLEHILKEVNRFTAGAPGQDDMALIVMAREP